MYEVINVTWERSNLIFELNKKIENDLFLVSKNKKIKLESKDNKIEINITNLPGFGMIEEGRWYLEINNEKVKVNNKVLEMLDDKSRIFKYEKDLYALLISFYTEEELFLYIDVNYMMKNTKYKKKYRLAVCSTLKEKITTITKIVSLKILNLIYKIRYFFNKNRNLVLFLSENSDELNSNFKDLYDYISNNHKVITYNYNIEGSRKNRISRRIKELFACSKAKYIFIDNYVGFLSAIDIPKDQVISQIWHAGVGFKAVGYARFGKNGSPHPFVSVHRKYTHAFVDSERLIDIYKEVFGLDESKFTVSGLPRLTNYTDMKNIESKCNYLYEQEPQLKNKKIILFSPTYRGTNSNTAYYDYSKLDLDILNKYAIENNFMFILKMHPFITQKLNLVNYSNIIDLSNYNINDLIYISDIMITDYSSCAYEYSFFNRPLVFYRYDKELYEYLRPVHTLDMFTDKQYEVTSFNDLMNTLEVLKNVDIKDRYENIREYSNDSLNIITKTVFGGASW